MGLFGFGSKNEANADTPSTAPGTSIRYDPELIPRFLGHHKSLVKLFDGVVNAAANHNYEQLAQKLKAFLRVFEQHVLEENVRFYVYLAKCMANSEEYDLVASMKSEMHKISRDVRAFARFHLEHGLNDGNIDEFKKGLALVGEKLHDRMEREESSLYTLYLPPDNYA